MLVWMYARVAWSPLSACQQKSLISPVFVRKTAYISHLQRQLIILLVQGAFAAQPLLWLPAVSPLVAGAGAGVGEEVAGAGAGVGVGLGRERGAEGGAGTGGPLPAKRVRLQASSDTQGVALPGVQGGVLTGVQGGWHWPSQCVWEDIAGGLLQATAQLACVGRIGAGAQGAAVVPRVCTPHFLPGLRSFLVDLICSPSSAQPQYKASQPSAGGAGSLKKVSGCVKPKPELEDLCSVLGVLPQCGCGKAAHALVGVDGPAFIWFPELRLRV